VGYEFQFGTFVLSADVSSNHADFVPVHSPSVVFRTRRMSAMVPILAPNAQVPQTLRDACGTLLSIAALPAAIAFNASLHLDLDLLRLGFLPLRQDDPQQSILELSVDLGLVDDIRQGEVAHELAIASF